MSELSLLKWQCRRGTKELDIVLSNYLERYYQDAGDHEQKAFRQLLGLEDPVLSDLLLGNRMTEDKYQQRLIIQLRIQV